MPRELKVASPVPPLPPEHELVVLAAMRRLRIKDIARRAGLPYQPVASIFRGSRRAAPDELEKLLAAIFAVQQ